MKLIEYQLKTALYNVEQAKKQIDKKRDESQDHMNRSLENYHYELLDIDLRLKDMINYLHTIEQGADGK